MTDKPFDNFVRDKLENYPSPIPEGLWEKIANEKTKRPKAFWWQHNGGWYAGMGIIALFSGAYFILTNLKEKNIEFNSTLSTQIPVKSGTAAELKKAANQTNTIHLKDSITEEENLNSASSQQVINKTNSYAKEASTAEFGFSKNKKFISSLLSRSKNNEGTNQNTTGLNNEEAFALPVKNTVNSQYFSSNSLALYNSNTMHQPPLNLKNILGLGNDCPSANGYKPNTVYVETYLSPDYSFKLLQSKGVSNAYLQKKDSTEHMGVGFSAGVRLAKKMGDHVLLKAGIQYSQIDEKFAQRLINESQTTTVIVTRTIVRAQGDTTIRDTTSVTQTGYKVTKSNNHYKNVDIPISIGYEFGDPESKWKIGVNGGVIFNVASWFNGVTLDTAYNIISADSKGSSGFYKTKVGLSFMGSVSIINNISPTLDIFAEPYFRYGNYTTNSSAGFSQKFNTLGIQLGLRMKISGRQHL